MFRTLTLELRPPIAEIRLAPASRQDSVSATFLDELTSAVERISEDASVQAVLVTSEGDAFLPRDGDAAPMRSSPPFRELELMPQPVIAVIEGPAEGAGLELALACDMRIASEDATFALPQLTRGVLPWLGATQRLPRLIGRARAAEMLFMGEAIDAGKAHAWGLVNAVAGRRAAKAEAERLAADICERGPLAVRYAKEAVARGLDMPLDQGLRYETDLTVILQTTADRAEGVRAFVEKRAPRFEGR
jgi:enoyl-CoA hydratase